MVLKVDKRKGLTSLSNNIERRVKRDDKTIRQKEKDVIDSMNKDIKMLDSPFFYRFNKDKKEKLKERAYTIPLSCWGFKENVRKN